MSIQNEVFKFVAEIELDEKTTNEFTAALKTANDHCDELRQTIAKNQKDLMKLSAAEKVVNCFHLCIFEILITTRENE